jgi:DNA-binding transcriptional MerR regulator
MNSNIKFTIEQVAEVVGVSKGILRNWEKVYDIQPARSEGNHRRYSRNQVDTMLKIKTLYEAGYAMKGIKAQLMYGVSGDNSIGEE